MKKVFKTLILTKIAAALIGCGSNKTVNFAQGPSRGGATETLAFCNLIHSSHLNGYIKVYTNSFGQPTTDTVEIYFDNSLAAALGNDKVLRVYKWYAQPDGTTYMNSTAVQMVVKDLATEQFVTGEWPEVSQALVNEFHQVHGLPSVDLQQFMTGKSLVITGLELEYDALRFSIQSGSSELASVDTLIPAFIANPNKYAATHPLVLQALHPNYSLATQPWTDLEFQQRTMSYCF